MGFTLESWKEKIRAQWREWREYGAGCSLYTTVSAAALLPVVMAAADVKFGAAMALGNLVGSVGSSLLANKLQKWKDEAALLQDLETEIPQNAELRETLDTLLEKLDAFSLLQSEMAPGELAAFRKAIQEELRELGNWERFQAVLENTAAARQIGDRAIVSEGKVENSILVSGDKARIHINKTSDPESAKKKI